MPLGSETHATLLPGSGSPADAPTTTKSRVLVYGMFGAGNAGDEAICLAVIEGVRRVLPDSVIYVMSQDCRETAKYIGTGNVEWLRGGSFSHTFWTGLVELWQTLAEIDVVIVGGGGLFQDQFSWSLPATSGFVAGLARMRGIPAVVLGAGIGPIRRRWLRAALRRILPHLTYINVRDRDSYCTAQSLGVKPPKLSKTADLVLSLPVVRAVRPYSPGDRGNSIGVALRPWPAFTLDNMADLVSALATSDREILLLCFSTEDLPLYESVLERVPDWARSKTTVLVPETLQELWSHIADLHCFLSMRLHGCVFSLGLNTPLLPIEGEGKVAAFASQAGLSEWLVTAQELGPDLVDRLNRVERFWNDEESELNRRRQELARRAARSFDLVPQALLTSPLESRTPWGALGATSALFLAGLLHEAGRTITWPGRFLHRQRSENKCR